MRKIVQHVIRDSSGKWAVKREGASRASKMFVTQNEAIIRAKEICANQKATLVIHTNDGSVSETIPYV